VLILSHRRPESPTRVLVSLHLVAETGAYLAEAGPRAGHDRGGDLIVISRLAVPFRSHSSRQYAVLCLRRRACRDRPLVVLTLDPKVSPVALKARLGCRVAVELVN